MLQSLNVPINFPKQANLYSQFSVHGEFLLNDHKKLVNVIQALMSWTDPGDPTFIWRILDKWSLI